MKQEMYRIENRNVGFQVVCDCYKNNKKIDPNCNKCNGKGIHKKTLDMWNIHKRTVLIERIDRASSDSYYRGELLTRKGELRYWTSASEYFSEDKKIVHFTLNDAQKECDFRNSENKKIIEESKKEVEQFIKNITPYKTAENSPIIINDVAIGVVKKYNPNGVIECQLWDRYFDTETIIDEYGMLNISALVNNTRNRKD